MTSTIERTTLSTTPYLLTAVTTGRMPAGVRAEYPTETGHYVVPALFEGDGATMGLLLLPKGMGAWDPRGDSGAMRILNALHVPDSVIDGYEFWWVDRVNLVQVTNTMCWDLVQTNLAYTISVNTDLLPQHYRSVSPTRQANITVAANLATTARARRMLAIFPRIGTGEEERRADGWDPAGAAYRHDVERMLTPLGLWDERESLRCWWIPGGDTHLPVAGASDYRFAPPNRLRSIRVQAGRGNLPSGMRTDGVMEVTAIHTPGSPLPWLALLPLDVGAAWPIDRPYAGAHHTRQRVERAGLDPEAYRYWHVPVEAVTEGDPVAEWFAPRIPEAAPAPEPVAASLPEDEALIVALRVQVESLQQDVRQANEALEAARERNRTWQNETEWVSQALMEEADRRDWCSDYDEFVDKVNGHCSLVEYHHREIETDVRVSGWMRVPYAYTTTITHTGELDFDSVEIDIDSYIAKQNADMSEAEIDDDYEVEEN